MNNKPKSAWKGFWLLCAAVAVVFIVVGVILASKFSGYLRRMDEKNTARENARSELTVEAYIAGLSGEYIAQHLDELYAQADPALQSREDFLALIDAELAGGIGYKVSFTSAQKRSYALYLKNPEADGRYRQIGEVTLEPGGTPSYGYTPWTVTAEHFDMGYLLTPAQELTLPGGCEVWVNGKLLGDEYIVQTGICYPALAPLAGMTPAPELPTLTAYRFGPLLGDAAVTVLDEEGNPVAAENGEDWDAYLPQCSPAQAQQIESLVTGYMESFVVLGSTKWNRDANFEAVQAYIVPGGALEQRLENMRGGAQWADAYPDALVSLTVNRIIPLDAERFVCDITYVVNVIGAKESSLETTHCQLLLVPVDGVLKVESTVNYLVK